MNSKTRKRHFIFVFLWLGFTVLAFAFFSKQRLVNFDNENTLLDIDYVQLGHYLQRYSSPDNNGLASSVIHFSKPGCECQQFSESHIEDINKLALGSQFKIQNVVLDHDEIIPAVPSVAIIDPTGEVIYFGPYGQGLGCSQTTGFAQTMLSNFLKGFAANIVIREAKGCYCSLQA
ncbi:DUF6436 domain-containing protein [Paraglaciecola sp. 2405UD69-4]|uniref:DUF6436 domain-containing protein n=1 Tax=Paraglaciecola sp. 2405UD69-4 TaxID=3391836 RepID=UPI0039C9FB8D